MGLKSQIPPQMDCGRTQTSSLGCSGGRCGWWACRLWRCVWSLSSFSPRCCRCLGWSPLCPHWGEGLGPDITKQFNQSSCHVWTNNMLLQVHTPYTIHTLIMYKTTLSNLTTVFWLRQELRKSLCVSVCVCVCLWYCWFLLRIFEQF